MSTFTRHHHAWKSPDIEDRVRSVVTAYLNPDSDFGHIIDEGYIVKDACIDGNEIVVTLDPVCPDEKPLHVRLVVNVVRPA